MFTRRMPVGSVLATVVLGSAAIFGQEKAAAPHAPSALEFPVVMRENVTAGKTPVGTKIKAKLTVATLVNGVVVPKDAVFSGEVTESVARSAAGPSRLGIRMDSAEWKHGSAPIKVYLTGWYYPTKMDMGQNLAYGPMNNSVTSRTASGNGTYPDSNAPASQRFPGHEKDASADPGSNPPLVVTSDHRVMMKNVESTRSSDGSVVITSKRSNIKLDKATTYVLAAGEIVAAK